jgi:NRAMP (natural resistance-associated macrophage protein)-like metal ion transporter
MKMRQLGPGLITGAADDDPSGIATYSQAGAQGGLNMLWPLILTYPLLVAIQTVSARIGCVTGQGLAMNMRRLFPAWLAYGTVSLLVIANTINIAADVAAMGEALRLLIGGQARHYAVLFGTLSLLLQVFMPYKRYVRVLKWLTLSLLTYVAVVFTVHVPWWQVFERTVLPHVTLSSGFVTLVVAVFGTTISPYLLFWQASQEVEELRAHPRSAALLVTPAADARTQLRRINVDTAAGMAFSTVVAFFIVLSTAVTLNAAGITNIATAAQAAEVLRPVAGDLAFVLFSLGIIGTGMLAVPVLAGSAAYAIADCRGWTQGLDKKWPQAKPFYAIVAVATLAGVLLDFTPVDPIRALFWSAVINGVIAVPLLAVLMITATRPEIMGRFVVKGGLRVLGWSAAALMFVAVVAMLAF